MKTVLLRAPLLTKSGYGVHARQIARWLFDLSDSNPNLDIHTELLNWGDCSWYTDIYACDGLIGRCLQASSKRLEKYDITIQLQLPSEWCPELGHYNVGVTAGIEATHCNPSWTTAIQSMDLVIVPSEFSKKSLLSNNIKVTTPVVVVPESFPDEMLEQNITQTEFGFDTKFNFLLFGQSTMGGDVQSDRKNIPLTLKWLFEEFSQNEDVGVILKTNMGSYGGVDRMKCEKLFENYSDSIKKSAFPRFYLVHGDMDECEVLSLYKEPSVKALVSLTHGEGFGLPLLEAAACDLPVICTDWSAHTEFLNHGKFIKIDYSLSPIPETRIDNYIWCRGTKWAVADEADFKQKVRRFYEQHHVPTKNAAALGKIIRNKYNFSEISKAYSKVLTKISQGI